MKNAQLDWRMKRLAAEYADRVRTVTAHPPDVERVIAERMRADGTRSLAGVARPRIFLVGTYYEQENSGFIQALDHAGVLLTLRTANGAYGLEPPSGTADIATIDENSRQIVSQVAAARRAGSIDVLIGTMVAQAVSLDALRQVRAMGIPVLNIAMDDRLPDHWQQRGDVRLGAIGLAPAVDLVLQTTPEYVPRYLADGHPAIFWPFGSDPELFRPGRTKRFDVCFVGNNYGRRGELIRYLQANGVRVECFGSGFPNGHIDARRVAEVFGESKIVLGVGTVAHSRRIVTLKLRDFDGPMSGTFYMTTDNPDLRSLFRVGEEIEVYRTPPECLAMIRRYLADDDSRERIAAAGRRRAIADHTWEHRLRQAFGLLGQ